MLKRGSYSVQQFVNLRKNYICFKLLLEFIGVRVACKCLTILYIESVKKEERCAWNQKNKTENCNTKRATLNMLNIKCILKFIANLVRVQDTPQQRERETKRERISA